jgi:hypothetical protein
MKNASEEKKTKALKALGIYGRSQVQSLDRHGGKKVNARSEF